MLPNRYKLTKMLQKFRGRNLEEGSFIICFLKLHEYMCELTESPFCKKYSDKMLPDLLEQYKILGSGTYKLIIRQLKQYCDIEKYGIYPTLEEAKAHIKNKINELRKHGEASDSHLYYE
mmetsp:Transcript_24169/g.27877  ORF Transcript_24169/g.27877 Transcript_24169/m.27877 type:complete len:119 (+) Transcript_24169:510-866(+)|eukprot:CAMPEP_0168327996 /NCGR_PEP_ID=MMETSP0213-20121227/6214_1 /TAXON_ID=151035 /ORGANISM="Euplotes harpa, Strain FSP1.4" /LENGTH=118 /DNA_ID=CAMNT_0008330975 /DNA_START=393 /DNA_END=749 /DNA_ORIENTATION=-